MKTGHLLGLLLLGTMLAGCVQDDGFPEDSANGEKIEPGSARVSGIVVTVHLEPIHNATIALVKDGAMVTSAKTEADGTYSITNVDPGEYRLHASAACCHESVRPVELAADEATPVDIQLEPFTADDLQKPYDVPNEWTGLLACSVRWYNPEGPHHDENVFGIPGGASGLNACAGVENAAPESTGDDFVRPFTIGKGLKTIVGAVLWKAPAAALGDELTLLLEVEGRWNVPPRYVTVNGTSPLEFRVDAGDIIEKYEQTVDGQDMHQYDFSNVEDPLNLAYRVFAGGMVNVVYQQQFTVYWDLYYWEPAPEGATALPDY